jgi:hypothetical protein
MHVTESEAASMYARACRAWYGRRAQKVVKDEIKRLRAKNDESGVSMWTLVGEQLLGGRSEPLWSQALHRPRKERHDAPREGEAA